jgi:hypothetical protein
MAQRPPEGTAADMAQRPAGGNAKTQRPKVPVGRRSTLALEHILLGLA